MKKLFIVSFLVLVTMFSSTVRSQDCDQIISKLRTSSNSYLYDFAQVFSPAQKTELTPILENLSTKTGINFFVITGTNIVNASDKYGNQIVSAAGKSKPSFNLVVGTNGIFFIHRGGECSKMMGNVDHKSIRNKYLVGLNRGTIPSKTTQFFTELSAAMLPTASVRTDVPAKTTAEKPSVASSSSGGLGFWAIFFLSLGGLCILLFAIYTIRQRRKKTDDSWPVEEEQTNTTTDRSYMDTSNISAEDTSTEKETETAVEENVTDKEKDSAVEEKTSEKETETVVEEKVSDKEKDSANDDNKAKSFDMDTLRKFFERVTRMMEITKKAIAKYSAADKRSFGILTERYTACEAKIDDGTATIETSNELVDIVTKCQILLEKKTTVEKADKKTFSSYSGGYTPPSHHGYPGNNYTTYNNNSGGGFGLMDWLILDAILDNHETVVNNYVDPSYATSHDTNPVIADPFASDNVSHSENIPVVEDSIHHDESYDSTPTSGIGGTNY